MSALILSLTKEPFALSVAGGKLEGNSRPAGTPIQSFADVLGELGANQWNATQDGAAELPETTLYEPATSDFERIMSGGMFRQSDKAKQNISKLYAMGYHTPVSTTPFSAIESIATPFSATGPLGNQHEVAAPTAPETGIGDLAVEPITLQKSIEVGGPRHSAAEIVGSTESRHSFSRNLLSRANIASHSLSMSAAKTVWSPSFAQVTVLSELSAEPQSKGSLASLPTSATPKAPPGGPIWVAVYATETGLRIVAKAPLDEDSKQEAHALINELATWLGFEATDIVIHAPSRPYNG